MEALGKLGINLNNVIIYLANFGVLALVVGYFITGPILRVIEKRRKSIQDNLQKAETIKQEFMDERVKLEKQRDAIKAEMEQQMTHLKKEMDLKRKEQEDSLSLKKAKMLEDMRTLMEDEKSQILKKSEQQTLDLIGKVIMHVVSNKIPADVVKDSVKDAWKMYNK